MRLRRPISDKWAEAYHDRERQKGAILSAEKVVFVEKLLPLRSRCPDGEMVDALVSGASVERRVGSSPILGTRSFFTKLLFLCPNRTRQLVAPRQSCLCFVYGQSCYATAEYRLRISAQTSLAAILNQSSDHSVFLPISFACSALDFCRRSSRGGRGCRGGGIGVR